MIHVGLDQTKLRFWSKVDSHSEHPCWVWVGYVDSNGYGRFSYGGRKGGMVGAHRMSVFLRDGVWPAKGMDVDHLCRNTRCVRPEHLEVVSHRLNNQRGIAGTKHRERMAAVTHCPQGHPYDDENTHWKQGPSGPRRACRACAREYARARRAS